MDFLRENQLTLMLILSGVCFAVTICGAFSNPSKGRKVSLFVMGMSATILMIADRYAYIYRGNESTLGFWMVRICNFLVYLLIILINYSFNWYLIDVYRFVFKTKTLPKRLVINRFILATGVVLLIISQFTGLYYTFDDTNHYQRANGFIICYIIPLISWIIQFSVIIQYRSKVHRALINIMIVFTLVPPAASVMQVFFYGLSLTNISLVILIFTLRLVEIAATKNNLALSHKRETELLKREQENAQVMLTETAYALAAAIDAKDEYTHGHSSRVAEYSEMIAKKSGMSFNECSKVYLAALLHDVGKIGIPGSIINKEGKLTDEEYEVIKTHTSIGDQILKNIHNNEFFVAAHYHHERYDGKGYPDGLKGEEIPKIARIIAVADSYDAMTSKRSYRDALPQQTVRSEIEKGAGTQFDPEFAHIMLELISSDKDYKMRQSH